MSRSIKFLLVATLSLVTCESARAAGHVKPAVLPVPVGHKPITPATFPLIKYKKPIAPVVVKIKKPALPFVVKPNVAVVVAPSPTNWYHKVGKFVVISANYPKFSKKVWNKYANCYCYFDPCTSGWYGWSVQQSCYMPCTTPTYPGDSCQPANGCQTTDGGAQPDTADGTPVSDPTTGDATTGDPTTGDPTTSDPTTSDATSGDPTTGDPTTGDPTTGDPTAGDSSSTDPLAGDPSDAGLVLPQ